MQNAECAVFHGKHSLDIKNKVMEFAVERFAAVPQFCYQLHAKQFNNTGNKYSSHRDISVHHTSSTAQFYLAWAPSHSGNRNFNYSY